MDYIGLLDILFIYLVGVGVGLFIFLVWGIYSGKQIAKQQMANFWNKQEKRLTKEYQNSLPRKVILERVGEDSTVWDYKLFKESMIRWYEQGVIPPVHKSFVEDLIDHRKRSL